ncbi:protein-disulfide reductase DsbD [Robbsia andropogonis]|uniref:protein-disulfide reductase DsbD n=1 Tax=Robbsia andropogonis TaxID=28092 RepID=UPI0004AD5D3B|nr:protein-disulfide reductase DsbD [Robbsia andropogonis]
MPVFLYRRPPHADKRGARCFLLLDRVPVLGTTIRTARWRVRLRQSLHRAAQAIFRGGLALTPLLLLLVFALPAVAYADDGFLDPSEAFRFQSSEVPGAVQLQYRIAPDYYLYRERFAYTVIAGQATLGAVQLPPGTVKFDQTFNKDVETYRGTLHITVPVTSAQGPFDLDVTSQGCSDKGVCYPPIHHQVHVAGVALKPAAEGDAITDTAADPALVAGDVPASVTDSLYDQAYAMHVLEGRSLPAVIAIFFVLGAALSLLPCSLPMIPILSSIILGEGAALTRWRGLALSATYILGMAIVYTVFGIAAALAGASLNAALQNPWVLGAFGVLLLVFAVSLLGAFELQLPGAWQSRVSAASSRLRGGRVLSVLVMGALSALLVGACMTAPLFGVLAFIAQTGNVFLGGVSLFAMAWGLGVPLLVVGLGAGALLPRAGLWMDSVKRAFGVLLMAAAVWVTAPVLPAALVLLGWAFVALVGACCLGVVPIGGAASTSAIGGIAWRVLGRALGWLFAGCAAALIAGALAGARDPMRPLAVFAGVAMPVGAADSVSRNTSSRAVGAGDSADMAALPFAKVRSLKELQRATAAAGRPTMLFFHADWCTSCVEMERLVFPQPAVHTALQSFALLQADVTANNSDDQALMKHFGMFGPPAVIFYDAHGRELTALRVMGYQPADRFAATLQRVLQTAQKADAGSNRATAASVGADTPLARALAEQSATQAADVAETNTKAAGLFSGNGGR